MRTMIVTLTGECPRCGKELVVRQRGYEGDHFVRCSGFPGCNFAGDYDDKLKNSCSVRGISTDLSKQLRALSDQFDLNRPDPKETGQ